MMYIVPDHATHVVITRIEFSDGGEPQENIVTFGTFEVCDQTAKTLGAISYTGSRPTKSASVSVYPLDRDRLRLSQDERKPGAK